jgi:hypothetical protein
MILLCKNMIVQIKLLSKLLHPYIESYSVFGVHQLFILMVISFWDCFDYSYHECCCIRTQEIPSCSLFDGFPKPLIYAPHWTWNIFRDFEIS